VLRFVGTAQPAEPAKRTIEGKLEHLQKLRDEVKEKIEIT